MNTHQWIFRSKHFKIIQTNASNFANLIVDKIESYDSDEAIVSELTRLGISVRIIESGKVFSHPKDLRKFEFEEKDSFNKNTKVGFNKGLIVQIQRNGKTYEMIMEKKDSTIDYFLYVYKLLSFIYFLIMSVIIYYCLRVLLNPMNKLHHNVKTLSIDTLDKPVKTKRTDELGELINSFNEMKMAIKNMIDSREQLLLDVSHELRTPLTRTNLSLEMMEESEEKEDILADVHEMETMISELLESAKIQSKYGELNIEVVNIIDLIDDVALYFENDKPGIEFVDIPEKVELKIDAERIKILLKNIFSNGIKYSKDDAKPVELQAEVAEDTFILKVKNYGEGIPEKDLGFIFEPFYRVDKSRNKKTGGYGLGMHLVQKIVLAHHGSVSIDSKFGEWAEVTVKLPM